VPSDEIATIPATASRKIYSLGSPKACQTGFCGSPPPQVGETLLSTHSREPLKAGHRVLRSEHAGRATYATSDVAEAGNFIL
jgi:hypothetical protein